MEIEEIKTYLNETSKLIFNRELKELNLKEKNILKLNIFVRSRHGEYGKKIADEIISYIIVLNKPRLAPAESFIKKNESILLEIKEFIH